MPRERRWKGLSEALDEIAARVLSAMVVVDTSALSGAMRGDAAVMIHVRGRRPGELFLVPPVAAEIQYGIARLPAHSRRAKLLQAEYARWRAILRWLPWNEPASQIFGEQKARLDAHGYRIDDMDLAVAAIALAHGQNVATCNLRHFGRVSGLNLFDWSRPPSG